MASDWIKLEHTTPDKPEVVRMAAILGIDQDAVLGKLTRLWIWADAQTVSGDALSVTETFIDRHVRLDGFAQAMVSVGWLRCLKTGLLFPNFDRHNGETAKARGLTAKRMKRLRDANSVTNSAPEERREEKSKRIPPNPQGNRGGSLRAETEAPCTPEEFSAYCATLGREACAAEWYAYYQRVGWQAARDWQAALRARIKSEPVTKEREPEVSLRELDRLKKLQEDAIANPCPTGLREEFERRKGL
jgi:hypothetical protein